FYHHVIHHHHHQEYQLNDYREHRRKQSLSLDSSLFDPSIIGSPLASLADGPENRGHCYPSRSKSRHASNRYGGSGYRFGYRLSMRIKKLYHSKPSNVDTKSSDALNTCASSSSPSSSSANNGKSKIQIRLR